MFRPTKVCDVELSRPPVAIEDLHGYATVRALIRLHAVPLGYVDVPVTNNRCEATALLEAALDRHSPSIIRHLVNDGLAIPLQPRRLDVAELFRVTHAAYKGPLPSVTVAVCTRDRTDDLNRCLEALLKLDYPSLDLLVIDNAPSSEDTDRLVRTHYPDIRYVRESRPGLDWARNRAIREAHGEIIAFTDDDAVPDSQWVRALAEIFAEDPDVMLVTGLVVPYELETEAQMLFEYYGGFGRGFERRWVRADKDREPFKYYGTGQFGTGANMAYRRRVFDLIGNFDTALDVGTVTNGGGDLEMFFRVLKEGHTLVYEPRAMVRHRHRREYRQLSRQITNNGFGLDGYFVRSALAYPDERGGFFRFWLWWLWWRYLKGSFSSRSFSEKMLLICELRGYLSGLGRYHRARRLANERSEGTNDATPTASTGGVRRVRSAVPTTCAVRMIELSEPLRPLTDVTDYARVRVFIARQGRPLGSVDIANSYQPVTTARLRETIARHLSLQVLTSELPIDQKTLRAKLERVLENHYNLVNEDAALGQDQIDAAIEAKTSDAAVALCLPADIPASVIVATRDRPSDLRACLLSLMSQVTSRRLEVIVVDNNPGSGLTTPVLADFPQVVVVNEPRQGASYARNAGFCTSTGEILITTDDDVTAPPDWIEKLVAPFCRADVMMVTGNVLPLELESSAQLLFEQYGGLSRGFERREFGSVWFSSPRFSAAPTWRLGGTANAALRASLLARPDIGLLDDTLGPGMPSGVGEDTYAFYKVLKAGHTLVYEPSAYVWHRHRRDMKAFRRQLYAYSKGHVAYHLTTLFRDRDIRGLLQLGVRLPMIHLSRIRNRLRGWSDYPLSCLMLEIVGNLAGPFGLLRSLRRVKREGRSGPFIPADQRAPVEKAAFQGTA